MTTTIRQPQKASKSQRRQGRFKNIFYYQDDTNLPVKTGTIFESLHSILADREQVIRIKKRETS
jgi:hypothetical protein